MTKEEPKISVEAQYIKDLSFENPNAPSSLASNTKPTIDLALDLNVMRLEKDKDMFEVVLNIDASAANGEQTLFILELQYAGIFTITGVSEDEKKIILGVHCPALLFPYARNIISDVTHSGGFQPLMLDPIDFGALFHSKMMQESEGQK